MGVLSQLNKCHQITALIRNGELEIKENLKVIQNFIELAKLNVFDLTNLLLPYIGDITSEGINKIFRKSPAFFRKSIQRYQCYIADVITEEWRIAPGLLEVEWFIEETFTIDHAVETFMKRLEKLEGKNDAL